MFNQVEVDEIQAATVKLGGNTQSDSIGLAVAWQKNVSKIDSDRSLPATDRSVWTEHDFAGALFLRDHLERALQQLSPSVREKLERYVAEADGLFRSCTVDDPELRMLRVAEIDSAGRKWWWSRIPDSGPIAEDLARY
ncbi:MULTISPECIES: hypothetical protein [unclassified Streptomyces]|uniref:hypothetical protein n=1 Tax=unclassified Streptomyces TaxID=2593676 RepID=UPI00382EB295